MLNSISLNHLGISNSGRFMKSLGVAVKGSRNCMQNTLLCTFVKKRKLNRTLKLIKHRHYVTKIFVFRDSMNGGVFACTYNVNSARCKCLLPCTFPINRIGKTNTLFTINVINYIAPTYGVKINWEAYRNSLLVMHHGEMVQIKTKLDRIIDL